MTASDRLGPRRLEPARDRPSLELAATDILNEAVLDAMPLGVVVLDRQGYVVKYNRFEEQLARRRRSDVIGRSFFHDVAVCTDVPEVRGRFDAAIEHDSLCEDVEFAFALPFLPRPRDVRLIMRSFRLDEDPYGIVLIEDISERKELEREKERLLSILMHDLNSPLHGILGYATLLNSGAMGEVPSPEQAKALSTIEQSSVRMRELIQGTLRDMQGEERSMRTVNLHALVLSSIGNLLPRARELDVDLRYGDEHFERAEFPRRAVRVRGIVDQIASLVQNLLSNAVKYADSEVVVDLREAHGAVTLEIRDDGPGIAPEERDRIFSRGYQAPGSRPGHGLGLFSVRRTVERHGGEISVDSALGEGSTFRVVLPSSES